MAHARRTNTPIRQDADRQLGTGGGSRQDLWAKRYAMPGSGIAQKLPAL